MKSTLNYNADITLGSSLFGAVKLTKNAHVDKHKYFGCSIVFDEKGGFSHPTDSFGNNAIIFEVDMGSSVHIDNKKKMF